jgi:hypothetical protein
MNTDINFDHKAKNLNLSFGVSDERNDVIITEVLEDLIKDGTNTISQAIERAIERAESTAEILSIGIAVGGTIAKMRMKNDFLESLMKGLELKDDKE